MWHKIGFTGILRFYIEFERYSQLLLSITDDLNPSTALILANAVYFKGKWANEFDPKLTMNRPFHIKDDVVTDVPTMFRKGSYKYADLPRYDAKCIELPYAVIFFPLSQIFFSKFFKHFMS